MDFSVNRIAVSGTDVYVGGDFSMAGGMPANHIAKWNGSVWSNMGSGFNAIFEDLAVSGTDVYATGILLTPNGGSRGYVGKWNGSGWTELGSGMTGPLPWSYAGVYDIAVSGTDVYAAGDFLSAGGT